MMLGVRISVGRQASEPDREELLDEDFALVSRVGFRTCVPRLLESQVFQCILFLFSSDPPGLLLPSLNT